jgi:hypothetical protein
VFCEPTQASDPKDRKAFFFGKKEPKNFCQSGRFLAVGVALLDRQSLFASFSSEKEDS